MLRTARSERGRSRSMDQARRRAMRRVLSTGPRWMLAALAVLVAYGCTPRGQGFCLVPPNYGFERIEVGTVATHPRGVSNLGSNLDATVVGYYVDAERRVHGFRREPGGAIIAIDVPGATETRALGINNNGEVVGIYNDAGGTKAFQLAPGGAPITIGNPAVPDAWSVNDDGIVAGTFTDPPGKSHGFTFPPGLGGPINVGNNFPTHLYGINNTRAMTGAMQDSPAGPFKAFYLSGSDTASFRAIPLSDV